MNAAWLRRRRNSRWRMMIRQVHKVPLGTPVTRTIGSLEVTVTAFPAGHHFDDDDDE